MKKTTAEVKEAISGCLDQRRSALTETRRVVAELRGNVLQSRACAMAIPMLYAIWEGYTKEVLQLYVEYLEKSNLPQGELKPTILAYAWTSSFRRLSGNLTHEKKVELIERFLASLTNTLRFEKSELEIDTKSNLYFEVLEGLAECLCLDISRMRPYERKLNALVNRRNSIAHGGREQKLTESDVEEYKGLVLALMNDLEAVLLAAIDGAQYLRRAMGSSPPGAALSM